MGRVVKKIEKVIKCPEMEQIEQRKRVVAYARVSTNSDEQKNSVAAQKDYYFQKITENPTWVYAGLYADEGISGLSRKNRPDFLRMMADAESGKFDMIITKSISRFARNTVDTLTCIRKLREFGCGVYFEKENLYSLDVHGEFVLTLLSSLAQEESRSISENVTWGVRKRFADGKFSVPYSHFLGYQKGNTTNLEIVQEEAIIVRRIFRLFLQGNTSHGIAKILMENGIPTPAGKTHWYESTIESILSNEKYKGDALLQKRYTTDYLTKKQVLNRGELPQYYISENHEAIIYSDTFDLAQEEIEERHHALLRYSGARPLSAKLICCRCGLHYRTKSGRQETYWKCPNNSGHGKTPIFLDETAMAICNKAIRRLFHSHIDECKAALQSPDFNYLLDAYRIMLEHDAGKVILPEDGFRILIKEIQVNMDRKFSIRFLTGEIMDIGK